MSKPQQGALASISSSSTINHRAQHSNPHEEAETKTHQEFIVQREAHSSQAKTSGMVWEGRKGGKRGREPPSSGEGVHGKRESGVVSGGGQLEPGRLSFQLYRTSTRILVELVRNDVHIYFAPTSESHTDSL